LDEELFGWERTAEVGAIAKLFLDGVELCWCEISHEYGVDALFLAY
jgi:hypothetical protein